MKRTIAITVWFVVLGFVNCVPEVAERSPNVVELGKSKWGVYDTAQVEGVISMRDEYGNLLFEQNWLHDTAIDQAMRYVVNGYDEFLSGGLEYMWVWHTVDLGSGANSYWTQITNTNDLAGGGDSASYITQSGSHTANALCVYDSLLWWRWTSGFAFTGDSDDTGKINIFYAHKDDTTALQPSEGVSVEWTLTIDAGGTIQAEFEEHLAFCFQHGSCTAYDTMFPIDSIELVYANKDSTTLALAATIDFAGDSTVLLVVDTTRSIANDTLKWARLKDKDGTVVSQAVINGLVANPSDPKVSYILKFVEAP